MTHFNVTVEIFLLSPSSFDIKEITKVLLTRWNFMCTLSSRNTSRQLKQNVCNMNSWQFPVAVFQLVKHIWSICQPNRVMWKLHWWCTTSNRAINILNSINYKTIILLLNKFKQTKEKIDLNVLCLFLTFMGFVPVSLSVFWAFFKLKLRLIWFFSRKSDQSWSKGTNFVLFSVFFHNF